MKPEEQQAAIAMACKWKLRWQNMGGGVLLDSKPKGHCWEVWTPPTPRFSRDPDSIAGPPDYLNDLNAMHEAEKFVKNVWGKYVKTLNSFTDPACATASQRAEAFLRTLNLYTL